MEDITIAIPNPLQFTRIEDYIAALLKENYERGNSLRVVAKSINVSPGYLSGVGNGYLVFSPKKAAVLASRYKMEPLQKLWLIRLATCVEDQQLDKWIENQGFLVPATQPPVAGVNPEI